MTAIEPVPHKGPYSTWSGTHTFEPAAVYAPASLDELMAVVETCGRARRRITPAGALHSWSACAVTDDVSLQMRRLDRVLAIDREAATVRAEAGIRLRDLYAAMDLAGLALPTLPNVDTIQLGGAVSNATHGTCLQTGTMCSLVASLEIVVFRQGRAEMIVLRRDGGDAHERHLFEAAVAGIGALGVIYAITLRCVPSYHSYVHEWMHAFADLQGRFEALARQHHSLRFVWFPDSDLVDTKVQVPITSPLVDAGRQTLFSTTDMCVIRLVAFANLRAPVRWRRARRLVRWAVPHLMRRSRAVTLGRSRGTLLRWTDAELESRLQAAFGANRFVNLEYAVPLNRCDQTIDEIRALFQRFAAEQHLSGLPVVVLRPVGADDAGYLAAPKGQSVVYVDVPYFADLETTGFYAAIERTLIALGGRCSWSRLFYAPPEEFLKNYPDHHRFVAAKRELDPENVFSNAFSDRICQAPVAASAGAR